jgi:hypothetical protein
MQIGLFSIFRPEVAANETVKLKQPLDAPAQLQRRLVAIWVEYAGNRLFDLIALE